MSQQVANLWDRASSLAVSAVIAMCVESMGFTYSVMVYVDWKIESNPKNYTWIPYSVMWCHESISATVSRWSLNRHLPLVVIGAWVSIYHWLSLKDYSVVYNLNHSQCTIYTLPLDLWPGLCIPVGHRRLRGSHMLGLYVRPGLWSDAEVLLSYTYGLHLIWCTRKPSSLGKFGTSQVPILLNAIPSGLKSSKNRLLFGWVTSIVVPNRFQ